MNPTGHDSDCGSKLTPEQEKKILESLPKGTLFIIFVFGAIFMIA